MLDKDVLNGTQSTENGLASRFVQASGQVCMGRRCRAESKEFFYTQAKDGAKFSSTR